MSITDGDQFANLKAKAAERFGDMENPMDSAPNTLIGASANLPSLDTEEEQAWDKADVRDLTMQRRSSDRTRRAEQGAKLDARLEKTKTRRDAPAPAGPRMTEGLSTLEPEFRARRSSGTNGRNINIMRPDGGGFATNVPASSGPETDTNNFGDSGTTTSVPKNAINNSDFDPADSLPRVRAVGGTQGQATTGAGSFESRAHSDSYGIGQTYVKAAGRCNHMRCQLLREKGLELMGAHDRFQGVGYESKMPAIPSVPVDKKYYGTDASGKENRSDKRVERSYKPADATHPEWVARGGNGRSGAPGMSIKTNPQAAAMLAANPEMRAKTPKEPGEGATSDDYLRFRREKFNQEFMDPTDLLEHHHFEGDDDFKTHPLPWDTK